MRSLDIAATGMQAQQTNVEVISNNIANMTTTGYKRRQAEFQDLIYQNLRRVGSNFVRFRLGGAGRRAGRPGRADRGDLPHQRAGQPAADLQHVDLAISGNGYFQVTLPSGDTAYTRDGTFGLSPDGTDRHRRRLCGAARHHHSHQCHLGHHQHQRRRCRRRSAARPRRPRSGTIQLATFPNEAGLDAQGNNLLLQSAASGSP